jgi:hypothetical protein
VLSVSQQTTLFAPGTSFTLPRRGAKTGRPPSRPRPDRELEAIGSLIAESEDWQTVAFRDGPGARR